MTVVVGRPIAIEKKTKNPSREEVSASIFVVLFMRSQCSPVAVGLIIHELLYNVHAVAHAYSPISVVPLVIA